MSKNVMSTAAAALRRAERPGKRPGPEYIYAERVRQLFQKNDEIRDEGLTEPEDVVKVKDLAYGTHPEQVLDIYYPAGMKEALPTIVSVHGGAFVYGDKERYRFYCMSLAQRGFTVVNFSYRLAPEHRFPAQLMDLNAVMAFVISHAGRYMADPENVFLVGDSAGAQMASQYSAAVTNAAYAALLCLDIPPFVLRACAFHCGFYKPDPRQDKMMMKCYLENPAQIAGEQMDVMSHVTEDYPPSFIMTCSGDFLRDRAAPFAELLSAKGVENELHVYSPDDRELGHVFHCNMREPYAKICNDEECAFFERKALPKG